MTLEKASRTTVSPALPEAAAVLCEAFRDYPVMRYILGPAPDYDRRLRKLVDFFVLARALRQEPILGVRDPSGVLVAAALVTLPGDRPSPPELVRRREELWTELGAAARRRYVTYGAAAASFPLTEPHHHLNMIGVRRDHMGRGLARVLIEAVHELARVDPGSSGVSLDTESETNVSLYQHLGYALLGHARVDEGLTTWALFKPKNQEPA